MSPLAREIAGLIRATGPIPLDRYMALALGHPVHGYYVTRDPLGRAGDFVTAPEVSQMFGEMIGLWAAETWRLMGAPDPVRLVELGPGRGTLAADALRAAAALPAFRAAVTLHLVETSPALRARQRATLDGVDVHWHDRVEDVPAGPAILLANEFLDALPVRQFEVRRGRVHERVVGLDGDRFVIGLSPDPAPAAELPAFAAGAPEGAIIERAPEREAVVDVIARRIVGAGGPRSSSTTALGAARPATASRRSRAMRRSTPSPRPARRTSPATWISRRWPGSRAPPAPRSSGRSGRAIS